jgi:predicted Zn-dependent peptidase
MKFDFKRKILKNGMTILFEKRNIPAVSVAFAVRNGGINERLDEKGISHFIEHMLYKGTPTRDYKKIAEEIEKKGGVFNGFTSEEITAYFCKMPSRHLDVALDVLSDVIKNPLFNEQELEKERKVIFEEIKMIHDNPIHYAVNEIQKFLYNGTLNVGTIGTYKTVNSINRGKIFEKFKQIYQPNNLILCVVGDADFKKIIDFAEKNFGNKKGKVPEQKFNLKNETKIEKRSGLDQASLIFAYHVPLANDKKNYAARVLSALMTEGTSSRLFGEIREKRNLAYAIKGDSNINKNFSYNFIYAGVMKENIEKIKKLILEEFDKVSEDLGEEELNSVKEQLTGQYKISMEDSQNQMIELLASEICGNAKEFYEYEKNISEVKLNDVKELAKKAKEKYSFFALVPED